METMETIKNRKGKIRVSNEIVEDYPDLMFEILSVFIPVFIRHEFSDIYYLYYGYCKLFDIRKEGEEIPEYDFIFEKGKPVKVTKL